MSKAKPRIESQDRETGKTAQLQVREQSTPAEERTEILGAQPDVAQKLQCGLASDNSETSAECKLLPEDIAFLLSTPDFLYLAVGFWVWWTISN